MTPSASTKIDVEQVHGSGNVELRPHGAIVAKAKWRDAVVLSLGVSIGVFASWAMIGISDIHSRAVDRVATEVRLEVEKNHPELFQEVTPFIECATVRQKKNGSTWSYVLDRNLLMPAFRSEVASCAKAADEMLARLPKPPVERGPDSSVAFPPVADVQAAPVTEADQAGGASPLEMPLLTPSLRPPQQQNIPPLSVVVPGGQTPSFTGPNDANPAFFARPEALPGATHSPLEVLGVPVDSAASRSSFQVVRPPEVPAGR